jgi:hypothetical protein
MVLFKPGGGNCKGEFEFNKDPKCPGGWLASRPTDGRCNGSDGKITNLDLSGTCGAATIHTSCSCDLALCDEFGDYRVTGAQLVGTDLLLTSK